jgi:hypothetical protein
MGKGTTFLLCTKDIRVALLKRLWLKNLASSGPGMRTGSLCAGHALHDLDTIPVAYAVGKRGNGLHSFFWRSFPPLTGKQLAGLLASGRMGDLHGKGTNQPDHRSEESPLQVPGAV